MLVMMSKSSSSFFRCRFEYFPLKVEPEKEGEVIRKKLLMKSLF